MLNFIKKLFSKEESGTKCFCPQCRQDLVGNDSFVSDDGVIVTYACNNCGKLTKWNFDCPVPFRID